MTQRPVSAVEVSAAAQPSSPAETPGGCGRFGAQPAADQTTAAAGERPGRSLTTISGDKSAQTGPRG